MADIKRIGRWLLMKHCLVCKSSKLKTFLSLGPVPLANALLTEDQLEEGELFYPLDVYFCLNCNHVGISNIIPPEKLFKNYFYMTSMSKTMLENLKGLVADAGHYIKQDKAPFVLDIGSNDGTLLKLFKANSANVLGVEPATNIAKIAEQDGIPTLNVFFNEESSRMIAKKHGKPSVITATNVFAHVADLDGFMKGVVNLLDENGVFIFENAYLLDLVQHTEFDTIYHEHLCYYAIRPLIVLFNRFGLDIVDAKRIPIHGGSIRVFVKKKGTTKSSQNVIDLIALEKKNKLDDLKTYTKFADDVQKIRKELWTLLEKIKSEGKHIVGYGATAKSTTLLNYCRIGTDFIDYITDSTPLKQNKFSPGMHIPIKSPDVLREKRPDYILLLAWNFADEIIKKEQWFTEAGGHFIKPIPKPGIIKQMD